MKFKDYLITGMMTTALVLGGNNLEAKSLKNVVNQTTQTQQTSEKKKLSTSELIKKATLEDCVDFVKECKKNTPFKQQIKKYGLEKTAEHIASLKSYSTDLAEKYGQNSKKIPKQEYEKISKQIGKDQNDFYKSHTDPLAPYVIEARIKTLEIAIKCKRKLITNNLKKEHDNKNIQKQYFDLIKQTFTKKEYTKHCECLSDAMDDYYDAIGKTLGWKIIIGGGEIKKMKLASRKHYFAERDKIYIE